jgi:hypothetical protein
MKPVIEHLVTTNKGWILRQGLKWITVAASNASAFLLARGVNEDLTTAASAAVVAAGSWSLETGLSFIARKYAVK